MQISVGYKDTLLRTTFCTLRSNFLTMRSIKPPREAMIVLSLESFPIRCEKPVKIRNILGSIGERQLNDFSLSDFCDFMKLENFLT